MSRDREAWLHGWPLIGTSVLIGTGVYCAGCGRDNGITTVVVDDEFIEWAKDRPAPEWPFEVETCPVCRARDTEPQEAQEQAWPKGKPRPLP